MNEQTAIGRIDAAPGHQAARGSQPHFTAGEALVQPSLNRISIHGRVAQVEPKVMQVLALMAERPGTVIPRETFLETVWAGSVGDDYLLNRAISELRRILDDDPKAPRYIETIRKTGYRLVAPIAPARVAAAVAAAGPEAAMADPHAPDAEPIASPPSSAARPKQWRRAAVYALVGGAIALGGAVALRPGPQPVPAAPAAAAGYEVRPLTSHVGRELEPALSPDGSRVAFIRDGGEGGFDLYVKTIGSEDSLNLTASAGDERHPLWTPDGRTLLFARVGASGTDIMRVSALGGGSTRVFADESLTGIRGMSLSPDGSRIAYAGRESPTAPYRIVLVTPATGARRVVSQPAPGSLGDTDPRFAPDGRSIVFVRAVDEVTKDLYRVPLAGGEPTRLTFDNRKINGLAWSSDGSRLLFTSTRSGTYGLWSANPDGGELRALPLGSENVQQPATAPGIEAIAFEQWMHRSQLRQFDLASGAETDAGEPLGSTRWDSNPAWSPDGERLAFVSNRGGPYGIWVSDRDGRGAVQVADFGGAFVDNPAWSPDGRLIAFDGSPEGSTGIFTVSAEGGPPRRIVGGPGDNRNPSWSHDGAWIYFESNRSGEWRIHAQPAAGGAALAVTRHAAVNPRESADGSLLLFTRPDAPGLWRRPREDWSVGASPRPGERLIAGLDPRDGANWVAAGDGIYFVRRPADGAPALARFDPATSSVTEIGALSPGFEGWGLDLSPDRTRLIYAELMMRESDLRLAIPR
ncbi:winged helix-turn-helix domain-containing protein [Luteimonas sp. RD2P54]|uniref:Winged helix-turn-helix domain-containing protein n=1 Tax=Luteimonas endophytica TaxID=3042023 RepID=A0ABT6J9X6_9GAMM|nr:LpqB family beta-propeller domain-containing protein [Luteimonas endophytica]MDH5823632.1 winged helix-turn-helix domain-containing protein [Luteimonas endophytica]